ncbi:MAG: hypothetical protein ACRDTA_27955 [Pseudonocardiaceae bacterium]
MTVAISQGRQGTADRDHDQRHPRLRTVQTADQHQPDRAAANRLHRQPALLGVQRISHDPIRGARAFTELTAPIVTDTGTRIPGLRFGDPRVHALLQALLIHRLLPHGFTNRDLRTLIAPLLGTTTEDITAGKMTYDLRRLRAHDLIHRIPHSRRYQITDTGLQHALFLTHAHDHPLRTGLAEITDPDRPPPPGCAPQPAHTRPPSTTSPVTHTSQPDPLHHLPEATHTPTIDSIMTAVPPNGFVPAGC